MSHLYYLFHLRSAAACAYANHGGGLSKTVMKIPSLPNGTTVMQILLSLIVNVAAVIQSLTLLICSVTTVTAMEVGCLWSITHCVQSGECQLLTLTIAVIALHHVIADIHLPTQNSCRVVSALVTMTVTRGCGQPWLSGLLTVYTFWKPSLPPARKKRRIASKDDTPVPDGMANRGGENPTAASTSKLCAPADKMLNFVSRYGARPADTSVLSREFRQSVKSLTGDAGIGEVEKLWNSAPRLADTSIKLADRYMEAVVMGRKIPPKVQTWAVGMRPRALGEGQSRGGKLLPSMLQRTLLAHRGAGRPRSNLLKRQALNCEVMSMKDAVPVKKVKTDVGVVHLTPSVVVDWVYQALVDTISALETFLSCDAGAGWSRNGEWAGPYRYHDSWKQMEQIKNHHTTRTRNTTTRQ